MSVSKDSKTKTWTVQLWYKDFAGKRKHTTKRGFATKKEAEKYEHNFLSSDHPEKLTVGQLIKAYLEDWDIKLKTGAIRQTTHEIKERSLRLYVTPYFKDTDAASLTTANIDVWIKELTENPPLTKSKQKRLSSGTIKLAKQALSHAFDFGKKNFGLPKNPVDDSNKIPYYSNDKRTMWTREQFLVFHNALADKDLQIMFDTIFASGLRIGEVLALTPNDIQPYTITVVKTIVQVKKQGTGINPPKTKSSERVVAIPHGLYFALVDYMNTIHNLKPTDRIFPCTASNARHLLKDIEKKLNLPHTSPHLLRHLYASTIYSECKDLTVLAKQLGHKNVDITAQVYTHFIEGNDRTVVDNLESVLTLKKPK